MFVDCNKYYINLKINSDSFVEPLTLARAIHTIIVYRSVCIPILLLTKTLHDQTNHDEIPD